MKNVVLLAMLTLAVLVTVNTSVRAQEPWALPQWVLDWEASVPTYRVGNESEFLSVLTIYDDKVVRLSDNVLSHYPVELNGETMVMILEPYNLQGADVLTFGGSGTVYLVGSTAVFNKGLEVKGDVTLHFAGSYTAARVDVLGKDATDNVQVFFEHEGANWDARAAAGYIPFLPAPVDSDLYPAGTIIAGYEGEAALTIGAGNWVKNAETVVGAYGTGVGTVNIAGTNAKTGLPTHWEGLGSFYIGYEGKGTVNITDGALVRLGAVEIGRESGSEGLLNISGEETRVYLFGRDDEGNAKNGNDGIGIMKVTDTVVTLDYTEKYNVDGKASEFAPKIILGNDHPLLGGSVVDHSVIFGELKDADFNRAFTRDLFDNLAGEIYGPAGSTLTFENGAEFYGSMKIDLGKTTFAEATLSPGFGEYSDHESFGVVAITGDFVHEAAAKTFIDFNVFGNTHYDPADPYGTNGAYGVDDENGNPKYPNRYLNYKNPTEQEIGSDTITVDGTGNVSLAGTIELRPQHGYYAEEIDIHFLQGNSTPAGQYDTMILRPYRWFELKEGSTIVENGKATETSGTAVDEYLIKGADGVHLAMNRNLSPFSDAANSINTRGVGGALDVIYNEQKDDPWLYVLEWVWLMDDAQLRTAMQQLAGETRAASFYMPVRSPWKFAFDRVNWTQGGKQSIYFGTQNVNSTRTSTNDLWANVFYDSISMRTDNNSSPTTTSRISFMAGYDRALTYKSAVGFIFSHAQPKLQQAWSRVEADDWLFGLHYANRIYDRYELKLWGGYGRQQYRMDRNIPITTIPDNEETNGDLSSNYSGNTVTLSTMVSVPYKWRNGVFRPFGALDLSYVQQDRAVESGFAPIALEYKKSDWTQFFGRIGVRADFGWERLNFSGSLAYSRRLLGDEAPHVQNDFIYVGDAHPTFTVHGNNLGSDFLELGFGTQIYLCEGKNKKPSSPYVECFKRDSMIFLQYNGSYGVRSDHQTASMGYQYVF